MESAFTVIPAIDIKGGKCVRLLQGKADKEKIYSENPVQAAVEWQNQGAQYLHVVDLDGAFSGSPVNLETVKRIIEAVSIPVEAGGGIRSDEVIESLLRAGADRAVIGTRAVEQSADLVRLGRKFREKLAVALDSRGSMAQSRGWVKSAGIQAAELAETVDKAGIRHLIYTNTVRDGTLKGVDTESVAEICDRVDCSVIASGGVSAVSDIKALRDLHRQNLTGVIAGKALYDKAVTLRSLMEAAA
ncbi:MAG: 1-(5-phosphoribosyl)-5-[(5-phosphoribosylamino)methylideneamino]imidazole-4-carboxamide isomerase [Kiritimatiellia bacterium]